MNKILLIAAAALFMLPGSLAARNKKAHAAKKTLLPSLLSRLTPSLLSRTKTKAVRAGLTLHSVTLRPNSFAWARAHTTSASLSSFTTLTWIVPTRPFVLMATLASHKVAHSTMPFTA